MLRAALEELAAVGWADFQVDAVAARAGVHKTTIYRRWPTRGALLAAALAATPFRALPGRAVPDTGTFPGDLEALLDDMGRVWAVERTRKVAKTLFAARHDPDIRAALAGYWDVQLDQITAVVAAAIERREIAATIDPRFVAEVFAGAVLLHIVELDAEVDPKWARQLRVAVLRITQHPDAAVKTK